MPRHVALRTIASFILGVLSGLLGCQHVWAACQEQSSGATDRIFVRHLSDSCTAGEREARAIPAGEILDALKAGKGIDLSGVVVRGDLWLDELPLVALARVPGLSEAARAAWGDLGETEGRLIAGPFSIQRSRMTGRVATRVTTGAVLVQGPHVLRETRCERGQDWSRAVFLGPVDWSRATFQGEAFSLRAKFLDAARFEATQFGPHTRFHRAEFAGPAVFDEAQFHGLAELLEVEFRQSASFTGARFEQGTGFSGSRFDGEASFEGADFAREVFFSFAQFSQRARFVHARFGGLAEFGQARFMGPVTFEGAAFQSVPQWGQIVFAGERLLPSAPGLNWFNYGIVLVSLLGALWLFWIAMRPSPRSRGGPHSHHM